MLPEAGCLQRICSICSIYAAGDTGGVGGAQPPQSLLVLTDSGHRVDLQHIRSICSIYGAYAAHAGYMLVSRIYAAYGGWGLGPAGAAGRLGGEADRGGDPSHGQKWQVVSYRCHFLVRELEAGHFGARGPVRRAGAGGPG